MKISAEVEPGIMNDARGVHPPVSDFPPVFENFRTLRKIFKILPFPEKISRFSSAEISDDLSLVIDHKFRISPYFRCCSTFPLCFAKIIISPQFSQAYYSIYSVAPKRPAPKRPCAKTVCVKTPAPNRSRQNVLIRVFIVDIYSFELGSGNRVPKSHTDEVGMVCWNDNLRGVAVALLLHRQNRIRS